MPFGSKLGQMRPYTKGDFIFGLNEAVNKFKKTNSPDKDSLNSPVVTVRQLTNVIDDVVRFDGDRFDQNASYLDFMLDHPKYHSAVVSRRFNLSTEGSPGGEGSNEAFRRKSKGALNYLISQKQYIHFILDDLRIEDVIAKRNFPNKQNKSPQEVSSGGQSKYRDVTGAELRWIFRHRIDPDTQEAVQFWQEGQPCVAPWDMPEFAQAWADYGLQVNLKHGL
jgi:hypothetical protein